jgi:hypothetical protein
MAGDVAAAQKLITAMGPNLDRAAVVRWAEIKELADGRERQAIGLMSEAFYPLASTEGDRHWLSSFLSGIPALVQEARQNIDQEGNPMPQLRFNQTDSRNTEAFTGATEAPINWDNVASEVKTMLELDPKDADGID